LLDELVDDAGRGARLFEAPRHTGHALQNRIQAGCPGFVPEGLLHERVLEHLVLDALGAELVTELRHLLHVHPGVIQEDRRGHAGEAIANLGNGGFLLGADHWLSSSAAAVTDAVFTLTPGPIVLESVMLRR